MINIVDKSLCCGCEACANACPNKCIRMARDHEGFAYPSIDADKCVMCGICEKVCPALTPFNKNLAKSLYAGWCTNENIRLNSSSGGVFTIIAESIIKRGGVVFGAKYHNDWSVTHTYTEKLSGIAEFRGSKYAQSVIGNSYNQVKQFLEQGREVLFSGTPCQVSGLRHFLRKDYEKLLTIDIVCHGVPSPYILERYLKSVKKKNGEVTNINFRSKTSGWKQYSVAITIQKGKYLKTLSNKYTENAYMQCFLSDLSLRPSCYTCPTKPGRSGSDITLGDFWGIDVISSKLDDDKGCSLIIINTLKGNNACDNINIIKHPQSMQEAINKNRCIIEPVRKPPHRQLFMNTALRIGFDFAHRLCFSKNITFRTIRVIYKLISK